MIRDLRVLIGILRDLEERRSPLEKRTAVITREVFEALKKARAAYNRDGGYEVQLSTDIELILKWDPEIEPHVPVTAPWVHTGRLSRSKEGKPAIRLLYRLAHPMIDDWMLEPLSHDISGVVRHELEHSVQPKGDVVRSPGSNWGDVERTRAYLLSPEEVMAFGTQVYTQAKRKKVPVTTVIEEKMGRLINALKRRDVPEPVIQSLVYDYRKAVTDYIVQRYPGAQFQTRSGKSVLARNLSGQWW